MKCNFFMQTDVLQVFQAFSLFFYTCNMRIQDESLIILIEILLSEVCSCMSENYNFLFPLFPTFLTHDVPALPGPLTGLEEDPEKKRKGIKREEEHRRRGRRMEVGRYLEILCTL